MSIEIPVKNIEREKFISGEEKLDVKILKKRSNAKTYDGWLISRIKIANKENKITNAIFLQELYKKYMEFKDVALVRLNGWKGKSGIYPIEKPDYFDVITYYKKDKYSKPKEIHRKINKSEVNEVINVLNELNNSNLKIPSRNIGERVYGKKWNEIFADRYLHTQLNLILRLLDYYGLIEYCGGYSRILKRVSTIQMALKSGNIYKL